MACPRESPGGADFPLPLPASPLSPAPLGGVFSRAVSHARASAGSAPAIRRIHRAVSAPAASPAHRSCVVRTLVQYLPDSSRKKLVPLWLVLVLTVAVVARLADAQHTAQCLDRPFAGAFLCKRIPSLRFYFLRFFAKKPAPPVISRSSTMISTSVYNISIQISTRYLGLV